ncbi:hypothetical protein BH11BAC3_BH11BAC3_23600 [soil metagenome]
MKILKIITSFSRYTDADFEIITKHIASNMTGNINFPSPNPAMAAVQAAVDRYSTALQAAKDLGRNNVAEKNESRQALQIIMGQLALYVMNVSLGSLTMLTSSGFPFAKEAEPQYITSPGNIVLSNGLSSGELMAQLPAVKGAKSYVYSIASELPTETTVWTSTASTTSKYTFSNLTPGKQYWVKVAVTGSRQQVAYSGVATQFAQ